MEVVDVLPIPALNAVEGVSRLRQGLRAGGTGLGESGARNWWFHIKELWPR